MKSMLKNVLNLSRYILLVISLCFTLSNKGAAQDMRNHTISYHHVIELSHPIDESIPLWPGDPQVSVNTVATMKKDGYYLRKFSIGEHSATHMNAPNSFIAGNSQGIDSYPASSLVHPAVVIDVKNKVVGHSNYQVTLQDINAWEKTHGQIPPNSLIFFDTGWGRRWHDPKAFINEDTHGILHFPSVSEDVALFLLEQRHAAGLGIDTHGLDSSDSSVYRINELLAKNHKIALECVANLDQMPASGATVIIGILRLVNGSGSPVALTALIP
jgi:kynurenine formamidase